jgi:hypothetical protein
MHHHVTARSFLFTFFLFLLAGSVTVANAQVNTNVQLVGSFFTQIDLGANTVRIQVARIENMSTTRTTGTLRLEVWATQSPYNGGSIQGYRLASSRLSDVLTPREYFYNIDHTAAVESRPPAGTYYLTLIVSEYLGNCGTSDGFCIVAYGRLNNQLTVSGGNPGAGSPGAGGGSPGAGGGSSGQYVELIGSFGAQVDLGAGTVRLTVARLENPSTTRTTGTLRLELWATQNPYNGGGIQGYRIATSRLSDVLTPREYFYNIDHTVRVESRPPAGTYYLTLIVSEYLGNCGTADGFCIVEHGVMNNRLTVQSAGGAPNPNPNPNPPPANNTREVQMVGTYSYNVNFDTAQLQMSVERLQNPSTTRTTGTLRLELWATQTPYSGGQISGYRIGTYQIRGNSNGTLGPNQYFTNVNVTVPVDSRPPAGSYYATLVISEYSDTCPTSDRFCINTYGGFPNAMYVAGPAATPPPGAPPAKVCVKMNKKGKCKKWR